jgi:hypothetical protein
MTSRKLSGANSATQAPALFERVEYREARYWLSRMAIGCTSSVATPAETRACIEVA